jgi:hypothetical protein
MPQKLSVTLVDKAADMRIGYSPDTTAKLLMGVTLVGKAGEGRICYYPKESTAIW